MAHSSLRLKPERPTKIKPENGDSCSGTHFDIAGFGVKPENGFLDRRTGFTGLTRAVSESGEPHKTINGIHFNSFTLCVLCVLCG